MGISGGRRRNPAGSLENDLQSQTLSEYLFSLVKCRPWGTLGSASGGFGAPGRSFFGPYKISSPGDDIFRRCQSGAESRQIRAGSPDRPGPTQIGLRGPTLSGYLFSFIKWQTAVGWVCREPRKRPAEPNSLRVLVFFSKMQAVGDSGLREGWIWSLGTELFWPPQNIVSRRRYFFGVASRVPNFGRSEPDLEIGQDPLKSASEAQHSQDTCFLL